MRDSMMKFNLLLLAILLSCSPAKEASYSNLLIEKEVKSKAVDDLPVKLQRFRDSEMSCKIYYQIDPKDFLSMRDSSGRWVRELGVELTIKTNQFGNSTFIEMKRDTSIYGDEIIRDSFYFELPARKDVVVEFQIQDKNKHVHQNYTSFWERDFDFIPEDFILEGGKFVEFGNAKIRKNRALNDEFNLEVYQDIFLPAERMYLISPPSNTKDITPVLKFSGSLEDILPLVNTISVESYCLLFPKNPSEEKKSQKFHFTLQRYSSNYIIAPLTYLLDFGNGKNEVVTVNDWTQFWSKASQNDTKKASRLIKEFNRRVKYANDNFGSYKSGWQTDRGMLYILLGKPDRIQNDIRGEVWVYGYTEVNGKQFIFEESLLGINKEDYVLSREIFYRDIWQSAILKWENGWVSNDDF